MKPHRMSRRLGSRLTLVGLVGGSALSLLILALIPHPAPSSRARQLLGHRRIHQEEEDYTSPKHLPQADASVEEVLKRVSSAHTIQTSTKYNPTDKAKIDTQAQVVFDLKKTTIANTLLAKAQETALTALQHGFQLTKDQKKIVAQPSPWVKTALDTRISKVRAKQEKIYIQQLRTKKQVKPRKEGGEEIISTPQMTVRFPTSLNKFHPRDWLPQYELFQNLTHYPWAKSSSCSNYNIVFAPPDTLPFRALASFPSSGNTWIRYLVEAASGMFTGSFYDDTTLMKRGMYGEGVVYNSGMTILQKTHGYTVGDYMKVPHAERVSKNHMSEMGHQGIIVIRNPFKALISHRHLDIGGHTGYAPKAHFVGKGWSEFVTLKIMLWKDFYMDWIKYSDNKDVGEDEDSKKKKKEKLHVTFYEKVKEDPVRELKKILTYLNLPIDEGRLRCLKQHSDWGLFKRKPSKNVPLDFNPFTRELKNLIYEAIDEVNQALLDRGRGRGRIGEGRDVLESSSYSPFSSSSSSPSPPQLLPLNLYQFYDSQEAEIARRMRKKRHR